jgi:hypothetical protein
VGFGGDGSNPSGELVNKRKREDSEEGCPRGGFEEMVTPPLGRAQ